LHTVAVNKHPLRPAAVSYYRPQAKLGKHSII
jgi:hypothetical protein